MLSPWVDYLHIQGAPVDTLLERSGIRPEMLRHPNAALPLRKALHWIELACHSLGTEHIGLEIGGTTSNEDLGHYGRALSSALTLYDYINQGIALYGTVVVGQSFWLSGHGNQARINLGAPWEPGLGDYQTYLNSFAITIANIRRFAGPDWRPTEIGFGFDAREAPPVAEFFDSARVLHRPGQTYIEFPRELLGLSGFRGATSERPTSLERLPTDLAGLAELQIQSLLCGQTVPIDLVAESLGTSRRSLQRGLAAQGVSYSDLLSGVRIRRAAQWLEDTDKPVMEIALDLGYSDASNFTRAFRRQTGVSPKAFRDAAASV
ncbi:AraC family transcriptional regulator [Imhoffiella purpurea]|uniref:Transcriptional regulator, AraC family n=1 Tax=Imhoffiella purpurea TaxID=1249627 RepID=W9UZX4_9GAMM|nr:AraC family transcriptional regulator [Imhoffiella purpurea]EXJ12634.1 transcriptional regulator, AraC family [Imhoffiella purpurea]